MKDDHLNTALRNALARYGTSELPPEAGDDAAHRTRRPARSRPRRLGTSGWVSIGEIEAAQPPNSYPRLGRRAIASRCRELAAQDGSLVAGVRTLGLRTWVRVAPPDATAGTPPEAADGVTSEAEAPRPLDGDDAPAQGARPPEDGEPKA